MEDEPTLEELIREAYRASEGVDEWDDGKTYYPSDVFDSGPRECSLEEVTKEYSEAVDRLIDHIKEYY